MLAHLDTSSHAARTRQAVWAGEALGATVRVVAEELRRRGIDPLPLLTLHGLDRAALWSPFARVSRGAVLCFVEDCLALSGDPALHVIATAKTEIGAFQMADYLGLMAPTVASGFGALMNRFYLVNEGCQFAIEERADDVRATFAAIHEAVAHPVEVGRARPPHA